MLLIESQYLTEQMPQRYTSVSGNKPEGHIGHAPSHPQYDKLSTWPQGQPQLDLRELGLSADG